MRDMGRSPRARGSPQRPAEYLASGGPIPASAGKPDERNHAVLRGRADPRERGEAAQRAGLGVGPWGRSPRARGSRLAVRGGGLGLGPIPASAGKPWRTFSGAIRSRADPRERGEARGPMVRTVGHRGRSPRARGSPSSTSSRSPSLGPIPASAGKPATSASPSRRRRADPRERGEARIEIERLKLSGGRSPRARGSLPERAPPVGRAGPIPASAGKPTTSSRPSASQRADPRERGEAPRLHAREHVVRGRSPRARGSLPTGTVPTSQVGPIPASAGKPSPSGSPPPVPRADPRERGEAIPPFVQTMPASGRSPRARGSRDDVVQRAREEGPIPASAGKPKSSGLSSSSQKADPRERGEAPSWSALKRSPGGRSPRARGSRCRARRRETV